jgi:predicted glycoside hydrolase/deacetylase ChbG (UPF0249 family)
MLELAQEYECAIRYPFTVNSSEWEETGKYATKLMGQFSPRHPDRFIASFYDEGATHAELLRIINETGEGTTEIMCHPGYVDEAFAKESAYNAQRARELKILTDPSIKQAIQANEIEMISFADL